MGDKPTLYLLNGEDMKKNNIEELKGIFSREVEDLGYELVDIEFVNESGENFLRFYIYSSEGVSLDDCEIVSRHLDSRLDELDPIEESYFLEVSSPDLNRPLSTNDDLRRNLGVEIIVNLYKKIDGSKSFEGILSDYDDDSITLENNNEVRKLQRKDISIIKILVRF